MKFSVEERAQRARENFLGGKTCAQAVLLAFSDLLEADEKTLAALSRPFGGGMGRLRLTCGAVSGAVMALGLFFPGSDKSALYALVQEYAARSEARNGSIVCMQLLTGAGVRADTSASAEPRTAEYYKKRPCPDLVYGAAELLGEMLRERGIGEIPNK